MNQQNLDYLKENLRFMGFGDKLYADLEKNILQGFPEFVLKMPSEFSNQKMDSTLLFKKSDQSDLYFFNRFDAHLHHRSDPSKDVQQTFYLNKGYGITLKEAFNLLQGRAVFKELSNKEGQKFNAWIQLDFKEKEENGNYKTRQYHQNYGYDLTSTLNAFPIKELQNEQQRERLLMSLEKGNVQSVTMAAEGREQMFFIEANPQFKSITVYDAHMKLLGKDQRAELLVTDGAQKNQVNHKEIDPGNQEQKKNADIGPALDRSSKSERIETKKGKTKEEKQVDTSAKAEKGKKEAVKNLLPQKKGGENKKGLRA